MLSLKKVLLGYQLEKNTFSFNSVFFPSFSLFTTLPLIRKARDGQRERGRVCVTTMSWFRWSAVKQQTKLTSFSPVVPFYNEVFLSLSPREVVISSLCDEAKGSHEIDVRKILSAHHHVLQSPESSSSRKWRLCIPVLVAHCMRSVFEINEAQKSWNPHSC